MSELVKQLADEFRDKEYAHAYMEEHSNMALAAQIKSLRESRGLTQAQLAEIAGMKQERICALENVNYDAWTIKTLRKLAQAFDTNLTVSFSTFSAGILDVANLCKEKLAVPTREKDLEDFEKHTIISSKGTWKAIDRGHLAPVVDLPKPGRPIEPRNEWQLLSNLK
jgi:transcriptional regulator with XRE-family HTH domain